MIPKTISVGIFSKKEIDFNFKGVYFFNNKKFQGVKKISFSPKGICFDGEIFPEIEFSPEDYENNFFELSAVKIGINFHWEKEENQRFKGNLKFIIEENLVTAINILPVEDYLLSVISSEMNANSSLELLKAHAVISRSWLLRPFSKCEKFDETENFETEFPLFEKIYERDNHKNFNVCADDHCQRYQGIAKATTELVRQAISATAGEVLIADGEICDARFSKSCGGISEKFSTCWANKNYSYLTPVFDAKNADEIVDFDIEENAKKWILSRPKAFCNTDEEAILSQVLNDYDQTTRDFFRWEVRYSEPELRALIHRFSPMNLGEIVDLIPLKRGSSARIEYLKIIGSKNTIVVGKELEIRRWLSPSHLYSSAFVVEKRGEIFTLKGAGWGHGVGLCQIGAAVMGARGFNYKEILKHYYKNAEIIKVY